MMIARVPFGGARLSAHQIVPDPPSPIYPTHLTHQPSTHSQQPQTNSKIWLLSVRLGLKPMKALLTQPLPNNQLLRSVQALTEASHHRRHHESTTMPHGGEPSGWYKQPAKGEEQDAN